MLVLKGIMIGIGKIIPGVSGSLIAISMGIYEELLNSVNNILKFRKKDIFFLLKISIGVLISIVLFSNIIKYFLEKYYFITMFSFIGLIVGSNKLSNEIINKKISLISFFIPTAIFLLNINNNFEVSNIYLKLMYYFISGILDAISMVIPGISGTAILMLIGSYEEIISSINIFINESSIIILFPFIIGLVIGILITSKIVYKLLINNRNNMMSAVSGFSASSIFYMFLKSISSFYTLKDIILGIIFMTLFYNLSKKINHFLD